MMAPSGTMKKLQKFCERVEEWQYSTKNYGQRRGKWLIKIELETELREAKARISGDQDSP